MLSRRKSSASSTSTPGGRSAGEACGNAPAFGDFDEMLRTTHPDVVIVTTVDRYHHEYIIRSLRGCDAITEMDDD